MSQRAAAPPARRERPTDPEARSALELSATAGSADGNPSLDQGGFRGLEGRKRGDR